MAIVHTIRGALLNFNFKLIQEESEKSEAL